MQRPVSKKELTLLLVITCSLALLLCGAALFPYHHQRTLGLEGWFIKVYDDRLERAVPGNSQVLSLSHDSERLQLSYVLYPGYTYPYAGVDIVLKDSAGNFFDFSGSDALAMTVTSSQQSDCKLYLRIFDPLVSTPNDPLSERYLQKDLLLSPTAERVILPFKEFTTPDWWFQRNNVTRKDLSTLDFSKVAGLQIESGATAKTGSIDTLTISDIRLIRGPNTNLLVVVLLLFLLCCGYTIVRLVPRKKRRDVIITYDKKEVLSYRDIDAQRIADYMAKHFSEPEISIVSTGASLGMSQKKVAKIMSNEFKMSFKQYLTSIRIHEAKRLLRETDRLVIDISIEVGFNSISHFNRVFKTVTAVTPLEFRNSRDDAVTDEVKAEQ